MKKNNVEDHKNKSGMIKTIGYFLLMVGIAIGLLALVEVYCFYLFSEGGRFHYEGFGFGSFMFGNIAGQIIAYYLLAALCIPLGCGHIKLKSWIIPVSKTLLWAWMVVGGPVTILIAFLLFASKSLSLPAAILALLFMVLSYLVFPKLLISFYRNPDVIKTIENKNNRLYWINSVPVPVLVLSFLYFFYILILQIFTLFNGIFPMFGTFLFGMPGILLLDLSIIIFATLIWGTLQRRPWAWGASVIWMGLFMFSTVFTFSRYSYSSLLSGLAFPPEEIDILKGIPVQGYHFAILAGIPLGITLLIIVLSKRYFKSTF
ncbi:MAG: hypothetical protein ACYC59_05560 [Anaerolineaceae bacterium]